MKVLQCIRNAGEEKDHLSYAFGLPCRFAGLEWCAIFHGQNLATELANGKRKSIRLLATPAAHAKCIGEPITYFPLGTRFVRKAKLDFPALRWEQHPRRRDYE